MTELERNEIINKKWVKFNTLDTRVSDVKDCYEINVLTKEVRNALTGCLQVWREPSTRSCGKRVELVKKNEKTSSYNYHAVIEMIRKLPAHLLTI